MGIGNDNMFVTKAAVSKLKKSFAKDFTNSLFVRSFSAVQIASKALHLRGGQQHVQKEIPTHNVESKIQEEEEGDDQVIVDTQTSRDELFQLEDLVGVRTIGEGAFGQVKLVKHTKTQSAMALKIQSKRFLKEHNLEKLVVNEIQVLTELNHPFINCLHQTFEDDENLYMLLEYIPGGEMFSLIGKYGHTFTASDHRFYAACVLTALESIHKLDIVYRDMKPENILIDRSGYCKIIDFGFAKHLVGRTYTSCGTPEYFSPELIKGSGYGKGNDIWSFGVLLYELIFGRNPFARLTDSKLDACRKIVQRPLRFHRSHTDYVGQHLLTRLLEKSEGNRIGCGKNGIREIREHSWFKNFNWSDLVRKELPAPWTPQVEHEFDSTNFCEYEADNSLIPSNLQTF